MACKLFFVWHFSVLLIRMIGPYHKLTCIIGNLFKESQKKEGKHQTKSVLFITYKVIVSGRMMYIQIEHQSPIRI